MSLQIEPLPYDRIRAEIGRLKAVLQSRLSAGATTTSLLLGFCGN